MRLPEAVHLANMAGWEEREAEALRQRRRPDNKPTDDWIIERAKTLPEDQVEDFVWYCTLGRTDADRCVLYQRITE